MLAIKLIENRIKLPSYLAITMAIVGWCITTSIWSGLVVSHYEKSLIILGMSLLLSGLALALALGFYRKRQLDSQKFIAIESNKSRLSNGYGRIRSVQYGEREKFRPFLSLILSALNDGLTHDEIRTILLQINPKTDLDFLIREYTSNQITSFKKIGEKGNEIVLIAKIQIGNVFELVSIKIS